MISENSRRRLCEIGNERRVQLKPNPLTREKHVCAEETTDVPEETLDFGQSLDGWTSINPRPTDLDLPHNNANHPLLLQLSAASRILVCRAVRIIQKLRKG